MTGSTRRDCGRWFSFLFPPISMRLSSARLIRQSNIHDFKLAAEACFPMISAVIAEIKNQTYPGQCFLNITLPTDIVNHKGKSIIKTDWRQVTSNTQDGRVLSTTTTDTNPEVCTEMNASPISGEHLLFQRRGWGDPIFKDDTDYQCLQEGYMAVTPVGALSPADIDCQAYFKTLVPGVLEPSFSSASQC